MDGERPAPYEMSDERLRTGRRMNGDAALGRGHVSRGGAGRNRLFVAAGTGLHSVVMGVTGTTRQGRGRAPARRAAPRKRSGYTYPCAPPAPSTRSRPVPPDEEVP